MYGQVIAILGAVSLAYYTYYYFDNFHYHVTHGYAHLGFPEAQHIVGQKLLHGVYYVLHNCSYNIYMYVCMYCKKCCQLSSSDK